MNSIRRSSMFDRPQLKTVTLQRTPAGYGLELQGSAPPVVAKVCEFTLNPLAIHTSPTPAQCAMSTVGTPGENSGVCEGDRVLEVNGQSVRRLGHEDTAVLISECPVTVSLLLHTRKPSAVPCGSTVHNGWLGKKGGSGITPRNWRRRWFVLRDDCIAYYYSSPEVVSWF